MSNWDTQKVRTLKKQWASITSGRNTSDHALATWSQRTISTLKPGEFMDFCSSSKGLGLHGNTARKYERMARALEKVNDADVWKAVGWEGARLLVRIEKQKEISALCRWVVTQAKKGPVTESSLEARIESNAPSYKPVGGARTPGKGPTKKALKVQVEKLSHKNTVLTSKHDQLVTDITKVIAKYPIIKNDLSPETITTLGLKGGQLPRVKSA